MSAGRGARRTTVGPIGEATDALEFSYVVQSGDFDADGVMLCALGPGCGLITLDGGTIRATADEADAPGPSGAGGAAGAQGGCGGTIAHAGAGVLGGDRVPSDWALKPSGVTPAGKFRLLFVTSTTAQRGVDEHRPLQQLRAGRARRRAFRNPGYARASGRSGARRR